jgi:hypothetical protein
MRRSPLQRDVMVERKRLVTDPTEAFKAANLINDQIIDKVFSRLSDQEKLLRIGATWQYIANALGYFCSHEDKVLAEIGSKFSQMCKDQRVSFAGVAHVSNIDAPSNDVEFVFSFDANNQSVLVVLPEAFVGLARNSPVKALSSAVRFFSEVVKSVDWENASDPRIANMIKRYGEAAQAHFLLTSVSGSEINSNRDFVQKVQKFPNGIDSFNSYFLNMN